MSDSRSGWPDVDLLDRTRLGSRMLVGLGRSGDARLYVAIAPLGEVVVSDWLVKVYKLPAAGDVHLDPVTRDRPALDLAANAAVTHSRCESLETIHEIVKRDGYQFMCFLTRHDAAPLAQTLTRKRLLPLAQALYIVELLADALRAVHRRRVVHRNIHPQSALVRWDSDGWPTALLTDLSCAKFLDGTHRELASEPFGGPDGYRAPEQHGTREHGLACDVYAMGRLAYEILAGQHLPEEVFLRQPPLLSLFARRPPPLSKFRDDLLPEFASVVERCLAYEPEGRPTANELMRWARSARLASQTGTLMTPDEMDAWLSRLGTSTPGPDTPGPDTPGPDCC